MPIVDIDIHGMPLADIDIDYRGDWLNWPAIYSGAEQSL